jgi:methylthioribulose-1-phosphate dehydratase
MPGRTTTVDVDPAAIERQLADDALRLQGFVDEMRETGADFHRRGWSLGTSSNYSQLVGRDPFELLITASGKDKGRLSPLDFVCVDRQGRRISRGSHDFPAANRPSAETMLHVVLAQQPTIGAVLHTHSVAGTLLSQKFCDQGEIVLAGYEMLKGLDGITTHATEKRLRIFANTQDIATLAEEVALLVERQEAPLTHGFLMSGHGLYAWGADVAAARRHIEVLEFLLECELRRQALA